jgi:hypothetical protein
MAKPIAPDGAIPLLEETFVLLRRAPMATLVCHLVGSTPLALGLLLFWTDSTNPRTTDSTCALESLVLALLLVWMNCWRAVFAARLRRQLNGVPDPPWNWRRIWRLVSSLAFLGATRLIVWPAAMLIVFPFAWVVAFYRSAAALAAREDLDPLDLLARARQLAGIQPRQSWALLPILTFLWLLLTVNLALALALLPQIVRILTGYESQFSRSGLYFIFNPLFLLSVMALSWIIFDPFVQAAYCVRCFHGESVRTGEDLRAGLRALTASAVIVLLLTLPLGVFAAVSPHDLEKSVGLALRSHEYDWRLPPSGSHNPRLPWLVRITDRLVDGLRSLGEVVRNLFNLLIDWLKKVFHMIPTAKGGAPPAAGIDASVVILTIAVLLLAAWIAWRRRWFHHATPKAAGAASLAAIHLDSDDLDAASLPEESWLDLAARSLAEQNFRFALRALYLANLAWLGRREFLAIHPGKTNHEYETELRRSARGFAEAPGLFSANTAAFERAWYGLHPVAAADADDFRRRFERMKSLLAPPQGAAA